MDLVRTTSDRPAIVTHPKGGSVYVSVHDDEYRRQLATLKAIRIAAHPDKGGSVARFVKAQEELDEFLRREIVWYAQVGLNPPGDHTTTDVPAKLYDMVFGHMGRGPQICLQVLRDGRAHTAAELMELGVRRPSNTIHRLRAVGLDIISAEENGRYWYQLADRCQTVRAKGRRGRPATVTIELLDTLKDGQFHALHDLETYFNQVSVYVYRLRKRGYRIASEVRPDGSFGYRLLHEDSYAQVS